MFRIQELSFINSFGQWIWGNAPNPEVSPDICLAGLPLQLTKDCWMQVIVKLMGLAMILGACLNKAPTLANIVQSKSVSGLPKSSIYGEIIIAANATLYGFLQGYPYTAYGENAAIALQCAIVMLLMWQYSENSYRNGGGKGKPTDTAIHDLEICIGGQPNAATARLVTTQMEKMLVSSASFIYIFVVVYFLPASYHYLLMSSVMPIMIYARGCQILEAIRLQHTGAQSIATTTISLGGNLGRILTTIKEVGFDRAALSWYCASAILNGIMFFQYMWYRKNTNAVLSEFGQQNNFRLPKEA